MFGQNSGWGQNNQQQQQGQQTGGLFGNTATGFGQQQPAQTGEWAYESVRPSYPRHGSMPEERRYFWPCGEIVHGEAGGS